MRGPILVAAFAALLATAALARDTREEAAWDA
jgi:hypothetical protein